MSEHSFLRFDGNEEGGLSSSFSSRRSGYSKPSIDWGRITDDLELRTRHRLNASRSISALVNATVPPLPPQTPNDPNGATKMPSDFIERLRLEEEARIKEEKKNAALQEEIDVMKITGTQQRERIMQLEANVAELTAMYKELKIQSTEHVNAQKSLATQLYAMNESWVGTSSDLKLQLNSHKQLEQRIWNIEQDYTRPIEIQQIERTQEDLQDQLKDVRATAEAASLRGYQTAFFSDTLLAALEEMYKGYGISTKENVDSKNGDKHFFFSKADQSTQEPSRAVQDMVSLMTSAMQSSATRAMHNDEKLVDTIKVITDPIVRAQLADTIKVYQAENEMTRYPKLHNDMKKELSMSLPEDPNFVHKLTASVKSAIPPAVEEVEFLKKIESVVHPLVNRKVEAKTSELLKEAATENEDVKLRIARLDDGLAANKLLVEQVMERQLQLPTHIAKTASPSSIEPFDEDRISMKASPKFESSNASMGGKSSKSSAKSPKNKAKATTTDEEEDAASIARLRSSRDKAEMRTETKSLLDHQAVKLRSEMQESISKLEAEIKDDLSRRDTDMKMKSDQLDIDFKDNISTLEKRWEDRISVLMSRGENSPDRNNDHSEKSEVHSDIVKDIAHINDNVNDLLMAREVTNERMYVLQDSIDKLKQDKVSLQSLESIEKRFDGGLQSVQECLDVLQGEIAEMDEKISNVSRVSNDTPLLIVDSKSTESSGNMHGQSSLSSESHQSHAPLTSPPAGIKKAEDIIHGKQQEEFDHTATSTTRSELGEQTHQQSKNSSFKEDTMVEVEDIEDVEDYSKDEGARHPNHTEGSFENDIDTKSNDKIKDENAGPESSKASKSLRIYVKSFVGKIVPLDVDEDETVLSVKSRIEAKEGMVTESQILIYNGQVMADFGIISDYNIVEDSTIHLKLKNPSKTIISVNDFNKNGISRASNFQVGECVEGKFSGGNRWFKGVIKAVNDNGTYQIYYDDDDKEDAVPDEFIRYPKGSPRSSPQGSGSGGFSREPSPRKGSAQSSPLAGLRMKASPVLQPINPSPKLPSPRHKRSPRGSSPSKPSFQVNPQIGDNHDSQSINLEDSMDSVGSLGELVLPARVRKLQEKRKKQEADARLLQQNVKDTEVQEEDDRSKEVKTQSIEDAVCEDEGSPVRERPQVIDHNHVPKSAPPVALERAEHELEEMIEHQENVPVPFEGKEGQTKEKTSETMEHPVAAPTTLQDEEDQVKEKNVNPAATSNSVNSSSSKKTTSVESLESTFCKDDNVLAIFEAKLGRTRWFPGKITECNIDGTYDVAFNDGDKESGISPQHIIAAVGVDFSPPNSVEKNPRPKNADGLVVDTSHSPHSKAAAETEVSIVSTNQEPSPSVNPKQRGNSLSDIQDDDDDISVENLSVPSEDEAALHEFDTDSDIDGLEDSADSDPAMKGMSQHLRRGTAKEDKKNNNNDDDQSKRVQTMDADDASKSLHEPGTESDFSNASTPTKSSSSPHAYEVEREIGGDALTGVMGMHEARARNIRQMSPRNATPGSAARRRVHSDSKEVEDEKYQDETNKTLENMDTSVDTDEDERILEGTGRENIWDRIQLSSGKRASGTEHILSSPKHGQAPLSPFSQISRSLTRDTPLKQQAKDTEDTRNEEKSSKVSVENDDNDGDADGPATSPGKESFKSPSEVLTEALQSLQSDPMKTAAAAKAMMEASSPEPVLTGVLRRRQTPKKNLPSSASMEASAYASSSSSSPPKKSETEKTPKESVIINSRNLPKNKGSGDDHDGGGDGYDSAAIREATRRAINASVSAVKYSEAREAAIGGGFSADDDISSNYIPTINNAPVPKMTGSSQCTFCLKKIINSEMSAHLKVCTLRYENCEVCGVKIRYIKMEHHLKYECYMRRSMEDDDDEEDEIEEDLMIPADESKDYGEGLVDKDI